MRAHLTAGRLVRWRAEQVAWELLKTRLVFSLAPPRDISAVILADFAWVRQSVCRGGV